jgi:transcriptional regulator with PAS, ATPase and Fis domain
MPQKTLHPAVHSLLMKYEWPGNVRELQHAIERAFILADDELLIGTDHFMLG